MWCCHWSAPDVSLTTTMQKGYFTPFVANHRFSRDILRATSAAVLVDAHAHSDRNVYRKSSVSLGKEHREEGSVLALFIETFSETNIYRFQMTFHAKKKSISARNMLSGWVSTNRKCIQVYQRLRSSYSLIPSQFCHSCNAYLSTE